MREFLEDLCENVGSKVVTKTDKEKGAFVLNADQRKVLAKAGYLPSQGGENATRFTLEIPNDPDGLQLEVSYYNSVRVGAGRAPETRMGREIVGWIEIGDTLYLANIGRTVFVWKLDATELPLNEVAGSAAAEVDPKILLEKARKVQGKPARQHKTISDFRRNAAVVAGAIARADGQCEMPDCQRATFNRGDGSVFLEVHHIVPLAEDGDDTLKNAAALCPTCHRELHFGADRLKKRGLLRKAVETKEN